MTTPRISLPPRIDRAAVLYRLDRVLDPELDESVLSLGFVETVTCDGDGNLTVNMRLPTYWCAANFSYLMASDARRELLEVEGVQSVTVTMGEHFAGAEIEGGAGPGLTFGEAFPEGGPDTLEDTRQLFLRKGFFSRQERLLRELKRAGLSFEEMAGRRVDEAPVGVERRTLNRYLERREELGLGCSAEAPLIVDVKGAAVPPGALEAYYLRARTTRLAMEASGSLCSAMLESRIRN